MECLEDDIEGRHDEDEGECSDRHTTRHTDSECTVSVCSGTTFDNQRNHSGNHRHDGHQDRTQTILTSSQSRLNDRHTLFAFLHRELGNQNSRLRKQTDQHDHTGLEVDVILLAAEP